MEYVPYMFWPLPTLCYVLCCHVPCYDLLLCGHLHAGPRSTFPSCFGLCQLFAMCCAAMCPSMACCYMVASMLDHGVCPLRVLVLSPLCHVTCFGALQCVLVSTVLCGVPYTYGPSNHCYDYVHFHDGLECGPLHAGLRSMSHSILWT